MFFVLGNVAVDETMAAPHLPAPGATVLVGPPERDLGGKGANQAIVLQRALPKQVRPIDWDVCDGSVTSFQQTSWPRSSRPPPLQA